MSPLTFQPLDNVLHQYDLLLFDLWGVIVEGNEIYPGVAEAIDNMITQTNVMFLTNAPRPASIVAKNLRNFGITKAVEDMVASSGDIARQMIEEYRPKLGRTPVIYHLGADRNDDLLSEFDHVLTEDLSKADILLLSLYRDDHEDIHEFDELLKEAAQYSDLLILCSNPDTIIPKQNILRYCSGYFAEIIEKTGGKVIYTGKPKNVIYDYAFGKHKHIKKDKILMIGDTFETDIMGANNAGIHSALVLTGNAKKFHNMHKSMDDKLSALNKSAKEAKVMPTFVTSIV